MLARRRPAAARTPSALVGDADDLRRSRLTVFFRLLLALPHIVWLLLWGIVAFFAVIANWFVTLFRGTPARGLHRFISALRPLPAPRLRVPRTSSRTRSPASPASGGGIRIDLDRRRSRRARTAGRRASGSSLPSRRSSSARALGYALSRRRRLTLVLRARPRRGAVGAAQLLRVRAPLPRADERLRDLLTDAYPHASPLEGEDCARTLSPKPPRRELARLPLLAVLAAAWAVAAWLLWRSSLPAYHLPHLDRAHALSAARPAPRAALQRRARLLWLGATLTQLVVLGVYARYGIRWMRESAAGPIGTGMLLGMIGFALVWAAQLPFAVLRSGGATTTGSTAATCRRRSGTGSRSASGSSSSASRSRS